MRSRLALSLVALAGLAIACNSSLMLDTEEAEPDTVSATSASKPEPLLEGPSMAKHLDTAITTHAENVDTWNRAVWANAVAENERLAAEAHAAEHARQDAGRAAAAVRKPAAPRAAAVAPQAEFSSGRCGGWEAEVSARWPAGQIGTACRIIVCESGGSPTVQNSRSSASGIYQALDGTWAGYGGYSRAMYAPASVQHDFAYDLWSRSGWSPWSCY